MTTYTAPSSPVFGGRPARVLPPPSDFDDVALLRVDGSGPKATANQALILSLHGSGTDPTTYGYIYEGAFSEPLRFFGSDSMQWVVVRAADGQGNDATRVMPWDRYGTYPIGGGMRQSSWTGWTKLSDGVRRFYPITHERLDAILRWVRDNVPNLSADKVVLTGGSMGAQGGLRYGVRRPEIFAAIYPSRPIWHLRRLDNGGEIFINDFDSGVMYWTEANTPVDQINGGTAWDYYDVISYVANTANEIPWIGWCVGRNDGGMPFSDHIAAVAALRSAGRGFAFAWNDGNHSTGDIIQQVYDSYPTGLFKLGKGYPIFSNHSLDGDPAVDLVGGINIGLTFRNVVETASSWSCEVTHISSACYVDVKPKSSIYTGSPAAQTVTIPSANTWVTVSF